MQAMQRCSSSGCVASGRPAAGVRLVCSSSSSSSNIASSSSTTRPNSSSFTLHHRKRIAVRAIEEKRDTAETQSSPSDLLSSEESRRIAELRRLKADAPAPAPSSNVIQGALEEAQLITWPKPGKALLDTVLVLAIVAGTGTALFGVNVALTDVFNWWYSH